MTSCTKSEEFYAKIKFDKSINKASIKVLKKNIDALLESSLKKLVEYENDDQFVSILKKVK